MLTTGLAYLLALSERTPAHVGERIHEPVPPVAMTLGPLLRRTKTRCDRFSDARRRGLNRGDLTSARSSGWPLRPHQV